MFGKALRASTASSSALAATGRSLGFRRALRVTSAQPTHDGKRVAVQFDDDATYHFHARWLRDSSPSLRGPDFYRTSALDVQRLCDTVATSAEVSAGGDTVVVNFQGQGSETFVAPWLRSFAPYVGHCTKGVAEAAETTTGSLNGTGSILDRLKAARRPFYSDLAVPQFDAAELAESEEKQIEFLETLVDPGCAMIVNAGLPESLCDDKVAAPMTDLMLKVVGRLNRHPRRKHDYFIMRKKPEYTTVSSSDYDHAQPLSMHTDHTVYDGTPGYLQVMYQAEGSVTSKVCDGLAAAEYMRTHHPEAYDLLTTVAVTHSSRNVLYGLDGGRVDLSKGERSPDTMFELVHTHPVIQLSKSGEFEKVIQSETKRGVCALKFAEYDAFMDAYMIWVKLLESERFVCHFPWPEGAIVCMNNWRVLHGRASVAPGVARTMVGGYLTKTLVENRHRLLKQRQLQRQLPLLDDKWTTRLPNQVLSNMIGLVEADVSQTAGVTQTREVAEQKAEWTMNIPVPQMAPEIFQPRAPQPMMCAPDAKPAMMCASDDVKPTIL